MKLASFLKINTGVKNWVCSYCPYVWICYNDESSVRIKDLLVHLLMLGFGKLVAIELKVLRVARIIEIKPKHINLELMI